MNNNTDYINRSEVRQIITGVADEYVHVTEGILADVDELPITTFAEKDAEIERLRTILKSAQGTITQAMDCIRGETPEDCTFGEAEDDTYHKLRDADAQIAAALGNQQQRQKRNRGSRIMAKTPQRLTQKLNLALSRASAAASIGMDNPDVARKCCQEAADALNEAMSIMGE